MSLDAVRAAVSSKGLPANGRPVPRFIRPAGEYVIDLDK